MERIIDRERHRLRRHSVSDQNTLLCGGMKELYQYCQSLRFPNEKLNCCHNGKVSLLPLSDYILKELFIGSTQQAINFRNNIRNYNSAFVFASFGAKIALPPGHGTAYVYMVRHTIVVIHCTQMRVKIDIIYY